MSSNKPVVRLPNLRSLKIKSASDTKAGPCTVMMTSLLNCWASNSEGATVCIGLADDLKTCMAEKHIKQKKKKSTINYHAARLQKRVNPKGHD